MYQLLRPLARAALILAGGAVIAACASSAERMTCSSGPNCDKDAGVKTDGSVNDDGSINGNHGAITSIAVTPADQILNLAVGTTQMISYQAVATYADGTTSPISGNWSIADVTLGGLDPLVGVFTANGIVGGSTQVLFTEAGGMTGFTSLTVNLSAVLEPSPTPVPDASALFAAAGPAVSDTMAQANILYPLDRVVFPQNVPAPLAQWNIGDGSGSGGASDWYRLTYTKTNITITQYVQNAGGFNFASALPDTIFSRLAESNPTMNATLVIDRLDVAGGRVVKGTPITLTFANGSVSGTVYYWAMDEARLHRVAASGNTNQAMFPPNIVAGASDPGYTYGNCIACHQISRDGRYLAANGDQAYIFDLTAADPTMSSMPVVTRAGYRWYFSSISPDNKRIFATMGDATFGYTDLSVTPITPTGTVPTANVAHPSWSPDGKTVAFISNVVGWTSIASFTGGDLTIVNVDSNTDVFSNLHVIHTGSSLASSDPAGGNADCFPTWTPDSKLLMFDHTTNTRGTAGRLDSSLYIMPPTTGATPTRLGTASDSAGHAQAHFPNTSPFISGGYYWIVFYSTRDYGNKLAGTQGTDRPQLWVSAISTSYTGASDPSSVPYWLPGQDVAHQNADAVWAASPCRDTGASCVTTSDCCSGACQPGDGGFVCVPPQMCRQEGETCNTDADCCGGGTIPCDPVIHTCQKPIG